MSKPSSASNTHIAQAKQTLPSLPASNASTSNKRTIRLFKNGSNQAVRIPREFELDTEYVSIQKIGDSLLIQAQQPELTQGSLPAVLAALKALEVFAHDLPELANPDLTLLPLDNVRL